MTARRQQQRVFAAPLFIGLTSLAGLTVALVGDGWEDWLAWALLGLPIATIIWAFAARRT